VNGFGGVGGATERLDLEMQTAVVGVDDAVGEPRADRRSGLVSPARISQLANLAARFLVICMCKLDCAGKLSA